MFGVDIMIDNNSQIQLIEINNNPNFLNDTDFQPSLARVFLEISLEM